jgi:hypothetical protein
LSDLTNCPECGSDHYLYVQADSQLGCPDFYGLPIYFTDALDKVLGLMENYLGTESSVQRTAIAQEMMGLLGMERPTLEEIEKWLRKL